MSTITDVKCVLSQKAFDVFCKKFHILEEVHPVLPNRGNTIHERPTGKIGLYTRFFDFANFRLPLSTFLVDILRHFHINISQLFVIGAAKVSHFEILCRVYRIVPTVGLFRCFYVNSKKNGWMSFIKHSDKSPVCYTKPLDSLKNWNDHFFWVDDFACPARFLWHTAKNVTRDPAPATADFNARDYATLVTHPFSFRKFLEEFLCLVGLSRHYTLDEDTYPSFLDKDGEDMDIFAFIHTPDPTKVKVAERERKEDEPQLLETTVGRTVPLLLVAPERTESELEASVDKLFDEGGSGAHMEQGDSAGGGDGQGIIIQPVIETTGTVAEAVVPLQPRRPKKRKPIVADAGGPSHPPKRLREDHGTLSGASVGGKSRSAVQRLLAGAVQNVEVRGEPIPTLPFVTSAPQRFIISSNSSHHSCANVVKAEVDSFVSPSVPVITAATTITSTADPVVVVKEKVVKPSLFFADFTSAGGTDPAMGGFTDLIGSDLLWNVTNRSRLDDGSVYREMVDEFAPPKFFASVRGMEHDQLFTKFNVGAAHQISLSAEVRMRAEYNIKERRRLKSAEAEATEAIHLRAEASKFKAVKKSLQGEVEALKERNTTLEKEKNELDVKVVDLVASVKVREQEVADLDVVVHELEASSAILQEKVTVYENCMGQLERFQDEQMKVMNDKFDKLYTDFIEIDIHSEERFYPHLLTTIAGRRWLLTHDMELAIPKCLNSPEYLSALGMDIGKAIEKGMQDGLATGITHGRKSVNFSLLAELKLNKDLKPLSTMALEGMEGTSGTALDTTMTLSVTFASTSSIPPISTDDYEVVHADGQEGACADGQAVTDESVDPFFNVDDAELNIS
ncbi:hypothetical protein Tco_0505110 [Tanacetum coccineum]